jgi:hypothetical protein
MAFASSRIGGSTVLTAGEHPVDRPRPGLRIFGQQPGMALRDVQYDRPRLEQGKIAFFVCRNLPERMQRQMGGLLHRLERNKPHRIRLAHFLQRPAYARIARQSLAAIGRSFKGRDGGCHANAPC